MRGGAIMFLLLCLFPAAAGAQNPAMRVELAHDRVDITTGFNGTDVVVFGTKRAEGGDVVLTLKGPDRTVIVRRKDRVFGAWLNRSSMEFRRVPSYYDYAATEDDAALETMRDVVLQGQIGVDNLDFYAEDGGQNPDEADIFRDALIRQMRGKGFFPIKAGDVQMLSPQFFRASFVLPPGVPTGIYTVDAMLVEGGEIKAREARTLQVGQVGFNARVYLYAENYSLLYGITAVLIALFSGWAAFTFLRRD